MIKLLWCWQGLLSQQWALFGWGRGGNMTPEVFGGGGKKALCPTPGPLFFTWQDCFYVLPRCKSKMKSLQVAHNSSNSTPESGLTGFGPSHIMLMLFEKYCYFVIFVGTYHSWVSNAITFICIMGLFNILLFSWLGNHSVQGQYLSIAH